MPSVQNATAKKRITQPFSKLWDSQLTTTSIEYRTLIVGGTEMEIEIDEGDEDE